MNRSEIMSKIRSKETKPEIVLRKLLWQRGLRGYRKNWPKAVGKPDIAWPKRKLAVFVDSCFWHYCPKHGKIPKTNSAFWTKKLYGNKRRDKKVTRELRRQGWVVLRFWTHVPIKQAIKRIESKWLN